MAARKRAVLARVVRKRPERELRDTPKRETLWWFDYETPKCQRKEFRGAYMYEGLQTFKSKGRCERALVLTPPPPPPTALPEVKNIRTTELRGNYASVGWDAVSASNVAYKVWLDGVAKGVAVTEPWKELSGLRPRTRYKVEIRTQPYSGSDRREPSEKVTYYFTTPIVEPIVEVGPPIPVLKTIKIRSESIGHRGTIYKAMTDLGANVSQFKYEVWQTIGRLTERIEVKGKETTNYGAISFNIPYGVRTPLDRRIAIKWGEQEIAGQRYKAGWTEGVVIVRPVTPPLQIPPPIPVLKTIEITGERGGMSRSGFRYEAKTNLGANVSQFRYEIWLSSGRGLYKKTTTGKRTTPDGGIWFIIPGLTPATDRDKININWKSQKIGGQTYESGKSSGVRISEPPVTPEQPIAIGIGHQPVLPTPPVPVKEVDVVKHLEWGGPEGTQPDTAPVTKPREVPIRRRRPERIAQKRQMSERVKELMKKRGFPKAVKEAMEKGLEREEAPRDIERIIEKVAKINEPNYILRKTIARRIGRGEIVQYKVDTDKGTIIYVNADENTANAILGMPTPTGEVIPLQIKVIR